MTPDGHLPYRFREKHFRDYEHLLAAVLAAWPGPYVFDTSSVRMNANSFKCRFSDMMASYAKHQWASNVVNLADFLSRYPSLICSERANNTVAIGSREVLRANAATPKVTVPSTRKEPLGITAETIIERELLCRLAHERILNRDLSILDLTDSEADRLSSKYDILLEREATFKPYVLRT